MHIYIHFYAQLGRKLRDTCNIKTVYSQPECLTQGQRTSINSDNSTVCESFVALKQGRKKKISKDVTRCINALMTWFISRTDNLMTDFSLEAKLSEQICSDRSALELCELQQQPLYCCFCPPIDILPSRFQRPLWHFTSPNIQCDSQRVKCVNHVRCRYSIYSLFHLYSCIAVSPIHPLRTITYTYSLQFPIFHTASVTFICN